MIDGRLSKIEKEMTDQTRIWQKHILQSFLVGDAPYLVPGQSLEKSSIAKKILDVQIIGSAEALPVLCVRCAR